MYSFPVLLEEADSLKTRPEMTPKVSLFSVIHESVQSGLHRLTPSTTVIVLDWTQDSIGKSIIWVVCKINGHWPTRTQCVSFKSPQLHIIELQVSHDLQLVDAAQVLHPVPELEQMWPVHCQLELMRLTEEEDLERREILNTNPECTKVETYRLQYQIWAISCFVFVFAGQWML